MAQMKKPATIFEALEFSARKETSPVGDHIVNRGDDVLNVQKNTPIRGICERRAWRRHRKRTLLAHQPGELPRREHEHAAHTTWGVSTIPPSGLHPVPWTPT